MGVGGSVLGLHAGWTNAIVGRQARWLLEANDANRWQLIKVDDPMPGSRPAIVQSRSVRHATETMLLAGLMVHVPVGSGWDRLVVLRAGSLRSRRVIMTAHKISKSDRLGSRPITSEAEECGSQAPDLPQRRGISSPHLVALVITATPWWPNRPIA
jgi:hypothetical protein